METRRMSDCFAFPRPTSIKYTRVNPGKVIPTTVINFAANKNKTVSAVSDASANLVRKSKATKSQAVCKAKKNAKKENETNDLDTNLKKALKLSNLESAFNELHQAAMMQRVASMKFEKVKKQILSHLMQQKHSAGNCLKNLKTLADLQLTQLEKHETKSRPESSIYKKYRHSESRKCGQEYNNSRPINCV